MNTYGKAPEARKLGIQRMKKKGKTTLYLNSFDFWNLFKKSFISGKIIENLWEEENTLCKELKKEKLTRLYE